MVIPTCQIGVPRGLRAGPEGFETGSIGLRGRVAGIAAVGVSRSSGGNVVFDEGRGEEKALSQGDTYPAMYERVESHHSRAGRRSEQE